MEFWGKNSELPLVFAAYENRWAEVKSGETLKVAPVDGLILHLSQANVGELKNEKNNRTIVSLFVNIDGKKLVLGTLFTDKLPQQHFDLAFNREFELSHKCKSGSVYFYGYWAVNPDEYPLSNSSSEEDDEDIPVNIANSAKSESKAKEKKPADGEKGNASKEKKSDSGKGKAVVSETESGSSDEDLISEDDDEDEDDSEDEDSSDDESDESEEEETPPKKAETSKKRPVKSATKTPVPDKKAKSTPQRTEDLSPRKVWNCTQKPSMVVESNMDSV
ncbi:Histone deacetylase HDT1 [Striga hermonthica]|uniref:Histone deacetylase HDT1 n=1 Tax=Striga hermonthica TaxID=68872 RepID=A0A9N7NIL7_STRHE|nr:Histone deacetylase HDT1 [Striga hermonthica]